VDVDSVADVSEVHAATIVMAEVSRVDECPYIVVPRIFLLNLLLKGTVSRVPYNMGRIRVTSWNSKPRHIFNMITHIALQH
jgi:hypothetical protein